jgi:phospholipase B1
MRVGILFQAALAGKFDCPALPPVPAPQDITQLHPSHVGIVMAVGDSITAAFTARSDLNEARDISWAIGEGSATNLTLPYMLSQYSAKVEGASTKAVLPRDVTNLPHNDYHPDTDNLNVAESEGSARRGSFDEEWAFLESASKKYSDFADQWKVLTVWMMANDFDGDCDGFVEESSHYKLWEGKVDEFLTNVTSTWSKIYINLVSTLDLSNIHRIQQSRLGCKVVHKLIDEGGCIDYGNSTQMAMLDRNIHWLNTRQHKFAQDWQDKLKSQGRKDVAVVSQPFMEGIGSQFDWTFLSELDCFHPSAKAHQMLAIGLWDSMLCHDRATQCGIHVTTDIPVTCPTVDSVFYTGDDVIPSVSINVVV